MFRPILTTFLLAISFFVTNLFGVTNTQPNSIFKNIFFSGYGLVSFKDAVTLSSAIYPGYVDENSDIVTNYATPYSYLNLLMGLDRQMQDYSLTLLINYEFKNGTIAFSKAYFNAEGSDWKVSVGEVYDYVDPLTVKQDPIRDKFNPDIFNASGAFTGNYDFMTRPADAKYLDKTLTELPLLGFSFYDKYAEGVLAKVGQDRFYWHVRAGLFGKQKSTEFVPAGKLNIYLCYLNIFDDPTATIGPVNNSLIGGSGRINILKFLNVKATVYSSSLAQTNFTKTNYKNTKSLSSSAIDFGVDYKNGALSANLDYFSTGRDYYAMAAQSAYVESAGNNWPLNTILIGLSALQGNTAVVQQFVTLLNSEFVPLGFGQIANDIAFPQEEATPNRTGVRLSAKYEIEGFKANAYFSSAKNVATVQYWLVAGSPFLTASGDLAALSYNLGVEKQLGKILKVQLGYYASSLAVPNYINNTLSCVEFGATITISPVVSIMYGYKNFVGQYSYSQVPYLLKYSLGVNSIGLLYKFLGHTDILASWKLLDYGKTDTIAGAQVNLPYKISTFGLMMKYEF